ncbi:MAG: DNA-binding protein [Lachnospiraceae bacterium]|nr:DNA-binding protein [Lachnospiraceae bacterium]
MERVTTKQAAAELNMDLDTLQFLMRENRLPIGQAVKKKGKKRFSYYIYRGLLDNYVLILSGKTDFEKTTFLYGFPSET